MRLRGAPRRRPGGNPAPATLASATASATEPPTLPPPPPSLLLLLPLLLCPHAGAQHPAACNATSCSSLSSAVCQDIESIVPLQHDGNSTNSTNGTAVEMEHFCFCPQGYGGASCEQDVDECWSQPCQNRATCVESGTDSSVAIFAFACLCDAGWEGFLCDEDVDECASIPCQAGGTCLESSVNVQVGVNLFECVCGVGLRGDVCEIDVDECVSAPCTNGGSCRDSLQRGNLTNTTESELDVEPGRFHCECVVGWEGEDCSSDVDECLSAPCLNGGVCLESVIVAAAAIAARDIGMLYFVQPVDIGDFRCECNHGWAGPRCDADVDECRSTPCYHGEAAGARLNFLL
eukprot:SAG11_NODE_1727_length_4368_cov_60.807683_4_plen_347_part_00